MEGAQRLKAGIEGAGRLLAKTERAQWLHAGTDKVGRLHGVPERNRLIQVGTKEVRVFQDRDGGSYVAHGWKGGISATG